MVEPVSTLRSSLEVLRDIFCNDLDGALMIGFMFAM